MRFVAGRGAAAERLAGALQRRAIGKMLLAVDTVTELLLAGGTMVAKLLLAGALLQNSIGKQPAGQQRRRPGNAKGQHRTAADAKGLQAAGSKEQRATQGSRRRIK